MTAKSGDQDKVAATPATGRVAITALAATLLVALAGGSIDLSRFYLRGLNHTLNDQVGYVSVARHLLDGGKLESSIIYPSLLLKPHTASYLYMPGHYFALAASFKLLGYSVIAAFLPGAFGYIASVTLVFWIGRRLYGDGTGYIAAALFALFPLNLVFAWTAMAELSVITTVIAAVAVFLMLPEHLKPYVGPVLIAIPMFFRETAAFLSIFMTCMVAGAPGVPARLRLRRALVTAALSALVVMAVMSSPVARRRPSLFLNNLLAVSDSESMIYTAAYAANIPAPDAGTMARLIARKFAANVSLLFAPKPPYIPSRGELLSLYFAIAPLVVGMIVGCIRRDRFAVATAASVAALLLLLLMTYTVWGFRGARAMLMAVPLGCIVIGSALSPLIRFGRWGVVALGLVLSLYAGEATVSCMHVYAGQVLLNDIGDRDVQMIEESAHDDRTVLVGPPWLCAEYVMAHYPVRWSFVPADAQTLALLEHRVQVGTIVYPLASAEQYRGWGMMGIGALEAAGWRAWKRVEREAGGTVVILRRTKAKSR